MNSAPDDEQRRLLELSDERDMWLRQVLAAERAAYQRGRAAGMDNGRAAADREHAEAWKAAASPIARGGPAHAQLDRLRYPPDGRESWILPDPDPGPEPEPELEI